MTCDSTLSICVGGLITAIGSLAWSLRQEIIINKLRADIYQTGEEEDG